MREWTKILFHNKRTNSIQSVFAWNGFCTYYLHMVKIMRMRYTLGYYNSWKWQVFQHKQKSSHCKKEKKKKKK